MDFDRPHRGQILVTDTIVTVTTTPLGGRTHNADPFIICGIKIPRSVGSFFSQRLKPFGKSALFRLHDESKFLSFFSLSPFHLIRTQIWTLSYTDETD